MKIEIGQKIKNLRLTAELTQAELADRSSLTKGFISQIENDQTSISLDSLIDILDALGTNISEFFDEESHQDRICFNAEDRVALSEKGASAFELLVPGSTNMLMDPIEVTLTSGESLASEDPHYGEEFGYVLSGNLSIKFGKHTHKVKKGNCFYFAAEKKHQFINLGKITTSFIWVMSPPQM